MPGRILQAIEIEVVHAGVAEEPVVLADEILRRHVAHERAEIEVLAEHRHELLERQFVGQPDHVLDRAVFLRVALVLVRLRIEARLVRLEIRARDS